MSSIHYHNGRRSSLLDKIPEDVLQRLDHAILDRRIPLRELHHDFQLAQYAISLSALQRYARQRRIQKPPPPPNIAGLDPAERQAIIDSWSIEMNLYRRNRARGENLLVEELIAKISSGAEFSVDDLCQIGATFARLKREDNAADRTIASLQIARLRAGSQAARCAEARAPAFPRSFHATEKEPWGHAADGRPHTQKDMADHLKDIMANVYGCTLSERFYDPTTFPIHGGDYVEPDDPPSVAPAISRCDSIVPPPPPAAIDDVAQPPPAVVETVAPANSRCEVAEKMPERAVAAAVSAADALPEDHGSAPLTAPHQSPSPNPWFKHRLPPDEEPDTRIRLPADPGDPRESHAPSNPPT